MRVEQIGNATLYHGDCMDVLQHLDVTVDKPSPELLLMFGDDECAT